MYTYQPFPKWIFHASLSPKIVETESEYNEHITQGWGDNPATRSMDFPEFSQVIDEPNLTLPEIPTLEAPATKSTGRKKKVTS